MKIGDFDKLEEDQIKLENYNGCCHINPPCSYCVAGGKEYLNLIEKIFKAKKQIEG